MNNFSLQAALAFLDSWLAYRSRNVDIPGFSIAIYDQNKIVFSKAYGIANIARQELLTPQSIFGVASQSKLFTTTAILQLVEQEKLHLDDTVIAYLPWLKKHPDTRIRTITIRQLLTHSAGLIRDGLDSDFWQLQKPFPDDQELRQMILAANLAMEPNTALKYSSLGFALLGQIVSSVTGQPHTDYVAKYIIAPLKLTDTTADYSPDLNKRLVTAYGVAFEHRRPVVELREPTRAFAPTVGVHATAEDMCRFVSTYFWGNTILLSDATKREALRTHWTVRGYDDGYETGLGFEIQHIGDHRVAGHSGHVASYLTATYFDPSDKLAVAVMANSKDAPSTQIARGIFETLHWFQQFATKPTPKQVLRFNARACSAMAAVEIVAADGGIVVIDPDDWEPFTFAETCERISPTELRLTTLGSIMNEGELLQYSFVGDELESVRCAGLTLLPETKYRKQFLESAND